MLSPCNSKHKFVVVELCDDIRIDTVQLANYEFFSGVFKDVKISLAENAPGDPLSWVDAGTYRAKNIRAVQVCGGFELYSASRDSKFSGPSLSIHSKVVKSFGVTSESTFCLTTATNTTAPSVSCACTA